MEVIILPDAAAIGVVAADAIEALLHRKPTAVLGLATGSSPLAIYDELAARCDAGTDLVRAGPRFHSRRVRGTARRPSRALPDRHRHGVRQPRRLRTRSGAGPRRPGHRHRCRVRGLRGRDPRRRGSRSADPRDRHRRAYRLQRTRVLTGLPHPDQDADPADPHRQRPVLRRRPGCGAHALPDPGPGDHHGRAACGAGGHRAGARPKRCTSWWKARSARCGRRPSCSITRM